MAADLDTIEQQITTAIGQHETQNGTTGVGVTLNNVGGMKYADWEAAYGATGTPGHTARFPDLASSWAALRDRVGQLVGQGKSLNDLMNIYAPVKDNNPTTPQRIADLANQTGLNPNQPIQNQASSGNNSLIPPDVSDNANPDQKYIANDAAAHPDKYQGGSVWGRVAAFAVGILCLGLGLLLLRQSQVIIEGAAKTAGTVAAAV